MWLVGALLDIPCMVFHKMCVLPNGPSERLDALSICFVCVLVCRKLSPHLGVRELDQRFVIFLYCFFVWFCILCLRVRACNCYASLSLVCCACLPSVCCL